MLISTFPFYYINDIHIGKKKNNNNKTIQNVNVEVTTQVYIKSNQIKFYSAFKQTNNNNNICTYININTERAGKEVMLLI